MADASDVGIIYAEQRKLELKHRPTFLYAYIQPALESGWIEMIIPERANDPHQKYRLTPKGKALRQQVQ